MDAMSAAIVNALSLTESNSGAADAGNASALIDFINGNSDLSGWKEAIEKKLSLWMAKGQYQTDRAREAFDRFMLEAAKRQSKGSDSWQQRFNKNTREKATVMLRDRFESDIKRHPQTWDKKLPMKWQGRLPGLHRR